MSPRVRFTALVVLAGAVACVAALGIRRARRKTEPPPLPAYRQDDPYTAPRTRWFRDAKYGLFVHWGLYSIPAGEWKGRRTEKIGEWIMNHEKIPVAEYEQLARQFNPTKFDAREWVRLARAAGMKYVVITSKHHDGFCLWDSAVTTYDVADATPFGRDPLQELSEACREQGLRFGVYHSIMDWHHPELAGYWDAGKDAARKPDDPRVQKYVEEQLKPQLRELVAKYDPDLLWFDGEWVPWWSQRRGREIEAYLVGLKSDIVINNRVGKRKTTDGDYETPEQEIPAAAMGKRLWETCMTLNDTWGYKHFDQNWKQPDDVTRRLCDIAGKGGNFLLNVGPKADGTIPQESVRILEKSGEWVRANGEAVYGTAFAQVTSPLKWGSVTRKGDVYYAIVFDWPQGGGPLAVPVAGSISRARPLHGGEDLTVTNTPAGVEITLPATKPSEPAAVIVLETAGR